MWTVIVGLLFLGMAIYEALHPESINTTVPPKGFTEEDMSPLTTLLMYDDFMEDGHLDDF